MFFLAPYIASIKNDIKLIPIIRVLAIKIPISSIYSMQHSYIKKRMEFKKFFISSFFGTILSGIVGVIMAYCGFGVWALIISSLVDQILDCIILFISTKWLPIGKISLYSSSDLIKFGSKILLADIIGQVYGQLRSFIIGFKYTTADLAFNSKGQKFSYLPTNIINTSVSKVLMPAFSNIQDDNKEIKAILKNLPKQYFLSFHP